MHKCKYFEIHELVPPHIYAKWGEYAWQFLQENSLIMLDVLRERFGPMTVNNYFWGGEREWSGLRTPKSPYYSETSQHTFGGGFDCLFKLYSADYVRKYILSNPIEFPYINSFETDVDWLHFDGRNCVRIKTYNPN